MDIYIFIEYSEHEWTRVAAVETDRVAVDRRIAAMLAKPYQERESFLVERWRPGENEGVEIASHPFKFSPEEKAELDAASAANQAEIRARDAAVGVVPKTMAVTREMISQDGTPGLAEAVRNMGRTAAQQMTDDALGELRNHQ